MIEINKNKIKIWSTIGQRATFGMVAYELANKFKDLIILTCDVSTSAGLDRFKKKFPEKFLELGISEQNMIDMASRHIQFIICILQVRSHISLYTAFRHILIFSSTLW